MIFVSHYFKIWNLPSLKIKELRIPPPKNRPKTKIDRGSWVRTNSPPRREDAKNFARLPELFFGLEFSLQAAVSVRFLRRLKPELQTDLWATNP